MPGKVIMKAVIIYDDFALAVMVNATLQRATVFGDEPPAWDIKPWRLDILALAQAAQVALCETADADLIVIASRQPDLSQSCLRRWLGQWAVRRQVPDAALALFSGESSAVAKQTERDLSQFARRHGLAYLSDERAWTEKTGALTRTQPAPERSVGDPPSIIERAPYERHWGINE